MPYFFSEYITNEKNAGNKARKDVEAIFSARGYKKVNYARAVDKNIVLRKIKNFVFLKRSLKKIPKEDILFIQYPFMSGGNTLLPYICKQRRVGIIIHDLDSLRMTKDAKKRKQQVQSLINCEYIIAQNSKMIEFLIENGCRKDSIYNLEVFDYLTPDIINKTHFDDKGSVCFSGNLKKSQFIYKLKEPLSKIGFLLYGNGLDKDKIDDSIEYCGAFKPDEIHKKLRGKFGLVWDGPDTNKCTGLMGEYLQYNDPHKISMYMVAGLPIIIWDKAAEATLVKQKKIGLVISSLEEIPEIVNSIDKKKYEEMRTNVLNLAKKMSKGYFLNKQLDIIESQK